MPRAVVFDLWGTLVEWPAEASRALRTRWAVRLGVSAEQLDELWYAAGSYEERESGPLRPVLQGMAGKLGNDAGVDELLAWRVDFARHALAVPSATLEALSELRRRGLALGLLSNCTEDVAIVWPETDLAPLFDAAVFSARARCMKPEARIYMLVCDALGVSPADCLFVGDGANDELAGAERVGMTSVLVRPASEDRDGVAEWSGPRVHSVSDVLGLVA